MRIIWSDEAIREVDDAVQFGLEHWPSRALRLADDIIDAAEVLGMHPQVGRPGAIEHTRELVVNDYPFVIVYAVEGDMLTILHVNHQRMQWPPSS